MVAGSLPASFASAKRCNISHVAHRNELEAQSVRYAGMETDALRIRERMSAKYSHVSPRVNPPPLTPTAATAKYRTISPHMIKKALPGGDKPTMEAEGTESGALVVANDPAAPLVPRTTEEDAEEAAVAAQLVMPQQQITGQLLCPGGDSREIDRHQEQTVLSSWDRLNVPRRVLEAHDLFVITAGRVKPYATQTQSPRRPAKHGGLPSPRQDVLAVSTSVTDGLSARTPSVRKGLSHLKNSSSVEVCFASVASDSPTKWTPRAASPKQAAVKAMVSPLAQKKKDQVRSPITQPSTTAVRQDTPKKHDMSDDLPEMHQAPGDALAAGDEL
jgi:hypothetical protein